MSGRLSRETFVGMSRTQARRLRWRDTNRCPLCDNMPRFSRLAERRYRCYCPSGHFEGFDYSAGLAGRAYRIAVQQYMKEERDGKH